MMNRSKLFAAATAAVLSCALLASCGSSSSSTSSQAASSEAPSSSSVASVSSVLPDDSTNGSDELEDVVNTLLESNPISNQFEIDPVSIEYDFMLKAEDVTSYKGIKSNDSDDAGLVLAIQPAAGKKQTVIDALKAYKEDRYAYFGNYSEFAQTQANIGNAIIEGNDDLVVMVIASNECSADLTKAVDSVINK